MSDRHLRISNFHLVLLFFHFLCTLFLRPRNKVRCRWPPSTFSLQHLSRLWFCISLGHCLKTDTLSTRITWLKRTSKGPTLSIWLTVLSPVLSTAFCQTEKEKGVHRTKTAGRCGETLGSMKTWQKWCWRGGSCYILEDSVISGKDFELYAAIFEELVKDFSQSHDYSIRLHFRALTPASVW